MQAGGWPSCSFFCRDRFLDHGSKVAEDSRRLKIDGGATSKCCLLCTKKKESLLPLAVMVAVVGSCSAVSSLGSRPESELRASA
jgi:hypothetical protein